MDRIAETIPGVLLGASSAFGIYFYYTAPDIDAYESKMLRGTATYVRQYEGEKPQEVLDYAQRTIRITQSFVPEKMSVLEKEVAQIREQLSTASPNVYKPVFQNVADKIEETARNKKENSRAWIAYSVIVGLMAGLFVYSGTKKGGSVIG